MTTYINLSVSVDGLLTDLATAPTLEDAGGTYGVRRTDTGAVVVASGTSMTKLSQGTYQYSFADPATGLTYEYSFGYTVDGTSYNAARTMPSGTSTYNTLGIPTSSHYSSEAEVMRLLGEFAIDVLTEDWSQQDSSPVWNDILDTVDEEIDMYIGQRYPSQMYSTPMLRRIATILAAHFLTQRRGNPGVYASLVARQYETLEEIRKGQRLIRGKVPLGNLAPVVRNYIMQPIPGSPQRIEHTKSLGDNYSGERLAHPLPYLWQY